MDEPFYPYVFEGLIDRHGVGRGRVIWYNVLFLPSDLMAEAPFRVRTPVRVEGEIADLPVAGAWMPTGDGRRWFLVGPRILKDAGVRPGDMVEMRFRLDDPDRVDVPDALAFALAQNPTAQADWDAFTPGKRRALAHMVASARTAATIEKRVVAVLKTLAGEIDVLAKRNKG